MSPFAWFVILFFVLCFLVVLVYALAVAGYYWGGKGAPVKKDKREDI